MLQHVDYRTSTDTGEIDNTSIAPVSDGEAAKQLNFRRPTENNRTRLEILRDTEREHLLLRDMVPSALWGGGTVTFGGAKPTYSGAFTITADMYLGPFQTAGDGVGSSAPYIGSTKAALTIGTTGVDQLVITSVKKQFESTTIAKADANRISVEILHDTATSIVLEGASGDVNNVKITIVSGTTTVQQLVDLINNDATVNQYVTAAKEGTTPGSATAPLWGPTQWGTDYGKRFLKGGMAGTVHKITAANLSAFFATTANCLQKGDSIAVWYDKMVDKTGVGGRVQSTAENGNTTIPTASIFNTRVNPEYIPGCVPICKCLDDSTLFFVDGTYLGRGVAGVLGAGKGAELGSLATPLGWDRIGTGPDHNPPTNLRQALDNADGHIDAILDEVEAARSSSVFGNKVSLDERIEAVDTHARHFISVGPGGMYTDLQTALLAQGRSSVGGKGGMFLVRQGNYSITTTLLLDMPCIVIGVESNVVITHNATGYAFTLVGSNFHFQNVLVSSGSGNNLFLVQGNATFVDCYLYSVTGTIISANASSSRVKVQDTQLLSGSTLGQQLISLTNGPFCVLDGCRFTTNDGVCAINSSPGVRLMVLNTKFTCSPFTPAQWLISTEGGIIRFDNVEWVVAGSGYIRTGFLVIQADEFTGTNLYFDVSGQTLYYGSANSPLTLVSACGEIDGLVIKNAGLIPDFDTDGFTLSKDVPYIRIVGFNGSFTLRNANISGFTRHATPSGQGNFYCIGDECSGVTGRAQNANGRGVFENVEIDFSGNTYNGGLLVAAFAGIQPASTFHDCRVLLGSTGKLQNAWYGVDAPYVILDSCRIVSSLSEALVNAITNVSSGTGLNPLCWSLLNNFIEFNKLATGGSQILVYFGSGGGVSEGHTITGNRIYNTESVATGQTMISLASGVNYSTIMGNTIKEGNGGNTHIADAGSGNLWAALNVLY